MATLEDTYEEADRESACVMIRMQINELTNLSRTALQNHALQAVTTVTAYDASILELVVYLTTFSEAGHANDPTLDITPLRHGLSTCVSCTAQLPPHQLYKALCPHWYCRNCTIALIEHSLQDAAFFPPRCCRTAFDFETVRLFIPRQLSTQYQAKAIEFADAEPGYCHRPNCGTHIPASHRFPPLGVCPSCNAETCLLCRQAWHHGNCVRDDGEEAARALAREQGWQGCPRCHRTIELTIGCNHITCVCGHHFCYVCAARWKTCRCPRWEEQRLLIRAQRDVNRRVANINVRQAQAVANGQPVPPAPVVDFAWEINARAAQLAGECQHPGYRRLKGRHQCDECDQWLNWYIWECTQCGEEHCSRCRYNRE